MLLNKYRFLVNSTEKVGFRKRPCQICKKYEEIAGKFKKNGVVAISRGVIAESLQKLEMVVDHFLSKSHIAAFLVKVSDEQ